jgi:hypothetical protein
LPNAHACLSQTSAATVLPDSQNPTAIPRRSGL